jgi:CDP-glucose 4,6-dehydratase
MFDNAFQGKIVWLSGHTGFKGAWLAEWLLTLGAQVHGFALKPNTTPSLFQQLGLADRLHHEIGDIRDAAAVAESIRRCRPDFVFHLAARAIVRLSYSQPIDTYATNVMGTAHVLEALRGMDKPCAAVLITTDKCYENQEWIYSYRENDPLGGYDPYSSSKAAAELVIAAYRRSFFQNHPIKVASGRAGNVIGGGDWADDRIVPDCIRALEASQSIPVRNKVATRPWQHVLEPLSGYLWLAARLSSCPLPLAASLSSAFNFGPTHDANRTVLELVQEILKHWTGEWVDKSDPNAVHEAGRLQLAIDKANALLGWSPTWDFATAIAKTVEGYRSPSRELMVNQITEYAKMACAYGNTWAR